MKELLCLSLLFFVFTKIALALPEDVHVESTLKCNSLEEEECTRSLLNVTLSGTVQRTNGVVQYSRLTIFDPATYEVVFNGNVCLGGNPFSISLPMGIYNVYYRGFVGGAQSYEVENLNLMNSLDTTFVIQPYSDPNQVEDVKFSNSYAFSENSDSVYISAKIEDGVTLDSLFWYPEFANVTNQSNINVAKVRMLDNGMGNDVLAGDNIYTSDVFYFGVGQNSRPAGLNTARTSFFRSYTGTTSIGTRPGVSAILGVVKPNIVGATSFQQRTDSVYVSDYIVNIVGDIDMSESQVTQALYAVYGDSFDFVNIFIPELASPSNYHFNVSNSVSGIGLNLFDNTAQFGSQGLLKGISVFPNINYQPPLNHETLHQWSSFMDQLFNTSSFGSHHGTSSIYGVHGGIGPQVTIINDSTVAYQTNASYGFSADQSLFVDLELYLMGLADTSLLRDTFIVVTNPVYQSPNTYKVDSISIVTPQDIVSTYGYRSPPPTQQVDSFRTATVVVSSEVLNDAGAAFNTFLAKAWEGSVPSDPGYMSFFDATGDRAMMVTKLPELSSCLYTLTVGSPGVPIQNGVYQALNQVNSAAIVPVNSSVTFSAQNHINLLPAFEVLLGAEFEALIGTCN